MKCLSGFTFLLLVISNIKQPALAQNNNLHFEHLTDKQGLSNNHVERIGQDREGFMWIGTYQGLNKYDGYNFTVFKHDPNNRDHSIAGSGERGILEDRKGNLWVSSLRGLNRIDKWSGAVTSYRQPSAISHLILYEDSEGLFWVGTSVGLKKFNPKTKEFIPYSSNPVSSITEDRLGRIWMFGRGISRLDRGHGNSTDKVHHFATDTTISFTSSRIDKEGVIWIGTNKMGLMTVDTKRNDFQLTQYNPGGKVNRRIYPHGLREDVHGFLWLATTEGLQRINRKTNEVVTHRSDPEVHGSLSSNHVTCIYFDREGTLWVGTDNGINKAIARPKSFHSFQVRPTSLHARMAENHIQSILEDRSGTIWVGNTITGLYQYSPASRNFKHIELNPGNSTVLPGIRYIYEDRFENIWVSTQEALHHLDKATGKITRHPFPYFVVGMDEDPSGKLWIAGSNGPYAGAIASFDSGTGTFRYYHRADTDTGLNNFSLSTIMASRTGDIWIGSSGGGINRLNPKTGRFSYYKENDPFTPGSLNANNVFSLYEDNQGIVWAGTIRGLNRFDPATNSFTYFTTREGLPGNFVQSIVPDSKGNLWIGTASGISCFNPAANTFRNYDVSDGLPDNTFTPGTVYSRNGKLLFGSRNGFVMFYPDSIKDNSKRLPVYITGLKVLEKSQPLPYGSLQLSYNENFVSFDFVALNYNAPEKNQYAYKLEGLDKDWIYTNDRRFASYTNLSPGSYTFRVKAANNDGIWNDKGASFSIIIHPPWWRTWWAYAVYVLIFLSAIILVHKYQRRRLLQRERERTREKELAQAREIEKAYKVLKLTQAQLTQSEKMASLGELTAGIAHEIQNPLNFINNFSEVNVELIENMQDEINKGNNTEVKAIAHDIKENERKISHHGKRADTIVKGMLQHSRTSAGIKECIDINALADEYLRLSYHGLRAKDNTFQANLVTKFDEGIDKVAVIPQDIGRVLLNLYNNAFYSISEKKKQLNGTFEPTVFVSTRSVGKNIEITVRDNGSGIPQKVLDKIYQPFFTTKPAGQGTGLGLSLSYDIITKGHGGELKVETKEGEFAEFVIQLPAAAPQNVFPDHS